MRERPIIFSGPKVRYILSQPPGTEIQTRRVVTSAMALEWLAPGGFTPEFVADPENHMCRYGVPGDRLWVRETFTSWEETCFPDGHIDDETEPCGPHCHQTYVAYAATPREGYRPRPDRARITYLDASTPLDRYHASLTGPWRPSIYMPRWASRITLELTEVRVQRLQEISEEDAKAEGCGGYVMGHGPVETDALRVEPGYWHPSFHRDGFRYAWEGINAKRGGHGWDTNPWVWALSFRRQAGEVTNAG